MDDREQLERWIAESERTRRRLGYGLVPAAIGALVVMVWARPFGALLLLSVGIVGMFGFWITGGHISEWETKLEAPPKPRSLNQHGRTRREPD
ncbi:MAG: hypothetical protein ABI467_05620 [Kofleriaceae bacterium]